MKGIMCLFNLLLIPAVLFAHSVPDISKEGIDSEASIRHPIDFECGTIKALQDYHAGIKRQRPPNGPKYVFSTHFVIHFDTTGDQWIPRAHAESISRWLEHSWAKQVDTLGWDAPPPDYNTGYDNRYDVYVRGSATGGFSGFCQPEAAGPDPHQEDMTSYIVWTYNRNNALGMCRGGGSHELNHAVQFSYSGAETQWWWYENTATWMMKVDVGDDWGIVGQGWLSDPDPLENPEVRMNSMSGAYEYCGGLWTRFLHEYYGILCPRQIWELLGLHWGNHELKDMDSILDLYYDSDLKKALGHYAIWRYFTGTRNSPYYFSESSTYITSTILRTHSTYPASGNQGTFNPSGPGGCNLIRFTNFGNTRVTIYFDGQNGYEWSAYVLGVDTDGISYEYKIRLEPIQDTGRITIPGWEYNTIALVPVVTHWTSSAENLTYTYSVTIADELADINESSPLDFDLTLNSYPNPVKKYATIKYSIPSGVNGTLKIFDASGRLAKDFLLTDNGKLSAITWDRRDKFGNEVQTGIYFYQLSANGRTIQKKMVVE